jgi:acyl-CoA thioesterase
MAPTTTLPGDFEHAVALTRTEVPGRFRAEVPEGWQGPNGANGGFTGALVARALEASVEAAAPLRSLTVHYLRRVPPGPVTIEVVPERIGRQVSTLTARVEAEGRTVALATAALAPSRPGVGFAPSGPLAMPAIAPPDAFARFFPPLPLPLFGEIDVRLDPDQLFTSRDRAEVVGWLRPLQPLVSARPWLVQVADALPPALFARLDEPFPPLTVDLTVHVRASDPLAHLGGEGWVLSRFTSHLAADGFWEEDGVIWAPDGTVLAQSRQLALA